MKTIIVGMCLVLSASLWSMERKGMCLIGDQTFYENKIVPLEKDPEMNSLVVIKYNNEYCWGVVRYKMGNEFSIVKKQIGNVSYGLLLPLEKLYRLADDEKNNDEKS